MPFGLSGELRSNPEVFLPNLNCSVGLHKYHIVQINEEAQKSLWCGTLLDYSVTHRRVRIIDVDKT